ncbi:CAAX prenyl protease 2 [Acropora cervicornis]|uniref:CAAX prenyl protease 2 n=1 Tax=Acropora cervicornis TaxID=6130 RepID=A0AAD9QGZ3_ACRCE|nr:CAAX prenyl protease 2 [Acropora cervicornis]
MAEGMCPLVSFTTITRFRGIISCLVISVAYVASLYVFKSPYPRDHPKTIKQRFRSVFIVSLLSPFYVWLWSDGTLGQNALSLWQFLGIRLESIIIAVLFPLLLTVILFTGPIVLLYVNKELTNVKSFIEYPSSWVNAISLRNYLVLIFTMLLRDYSLVKTLRMFGLMHFGYTTVFGGYSAFLFLRTGKLTHPNVVFDCHLIGPVICHTFCNFMGFPVIDQIPSSKYPRFISASFLAGLILFLVLALPLTNPTWYNSIYYQQQLVR